MDLDFYFNQMLRRKEWSVSPRVPAQVLRPCISKTIERALALRQLELQVQDWIEEEANKLEEPIKQLLLINAKDEIKHDKALETVTAATFPYPQRYCTTVYDFRQELCEISEIDGAITVAGTVEASIFFVVLPILRFLGSPAMRTAATDISNDESIHVACNVQLAKDLGYTRSMRLNRARKEVVRWLVKDLPYSNPTNPKESQSHWLKASDDLYERGRTDTLIETKAPIMNALYEQDNRHITIYE